MNLNFIVSERDKNTTSQIQNFDGIFINDYIIIIEFLHDMAKNGHYVASCYTAGDAITVLEEYLQLDNMMEMLEPNDSIWNEGKIKELKRRAPKEVEEWTTENGRA